MNPEAQKVLDEILKKDPNTLTMDDIKFLRARRDYLKKTQLEEYDSVLNPEVKKEPVQVEPENQTSEESEPVKQTNGKKSR